MMVLVVECVVVIVLLMVSGFIPARSLMSIFELERRKAAGDRHAAATLHREVLLDDIISLQRILAALLLVIFVSVTVAAFGWLAGVVASLFVALAYGAVAQIGIVQRLSQKLYNQHEPVLLQFVERFGGVIRFIRSVSPAIPAPKKVDSREELEYLLANSAAVLSVDEKKLITHALQFEDRLVSEVMTPRGVIDSIGTNELLGPLVLDDLHRTGHSRFPVTDGDIDHVVGMVYIQSLLALDHKRSLTAGKTMEPHVFYIHQDQSLAHALTAFIRTHHHLFIVINEFRETVGLLSLEDVVEALLGRQIVDEFDAHDDLRVVAARNIRGNNDPKKHK